MHIEIRRSNRRTMALEITPEAKVIVRAPFRLPDAEIQRFLKEKEDWINKNVKKAIQKKEQYAKQDKLTIEDIHKLANEALAIIPSKVVFFATKIGVSYGRIVIRNQKSRWGSCSAKGNLNFNCLLMLTPEEVQDYVVVHELCHRKEMNHGHCFWQEVERIIPDYKERRQWLKDYGSSIIGSMIE